MHTAAITPTIIVTDQSIGMLHIRRAAALANPATYIAHFVLLCHHCSPFCSATRDDANIMFAQRFNPATGQLEWAVVDVAGDSAQANKHHQRHHNASRRR